MTKHIALVFDVERRVLIAGSNDLHPAFTSMHLKDGYIVLTCEGGYSWAFVETQPVLVEPIEQQP
jgi:hypothetical protein